MRRSFTPDAFRMRIASIITAEPAPLSVAPVPLCHESKCAPSITISSALSVPGSSAITLNAVWLGVVVFLTFSSTVTGTFLSSVRAMRL